MGNLSLGKTINSVNIIVVFFLALIGFVIFYPLFYFRIFRKTDSFALVILDILVMIFSAVFLFYNLGVGFPGTFVFIKSNFIISCLSLFTSIFLLYQWYRYTCKQNNFNIKSNWMLSCKLIGSVILFLIIIFPIDSSLWLHTYKNWNFTFSGLLQSFSVGIREEVLFRGIALILIMWALRKKNTGTIISISIQGLIFGFMHLINLTDHSVPVSSIIASTIDAAGIGVLFAIVFLISKNIWIPIVLHALWDYLQISMTGAMNISVGGTLGFIITCSIGIVSIIFSYILYTKEHQVIEKHVREILGDELSYILY